MKRLSVALPRGHALLKCHNVRTAVSSGWGRPPGEFSRQFKPKLPAACLPRRCPGRPNRARHGLCLEQPPL